MKDMKSSTQKNSNNFLKYKGKPLVRCGNVIYYGDMNDNYVVKIESKSSKVASGLAISDVLNVEMIDTHIEDMNSKKIVKVSEKKGLYSAVDIANAWLDRALN